MDIKYFLYNNNNLNDYQKEEIEIVREGYLCLANLIDNVYDCETKSEAVNEVIKYKHATFYCSVFI